MPEASLFSAVHRDSIIQIRADSFITVPKGLFDTGTLHGSYISKAFVKRNIKALAPFLKPCKGLVRLADNKTTTFKQQAKEQTDMPAGSKTLPRVQNLAHLHTNVLLLLFLFFHSFAHFSSEYE